MQFLLENVTVKDSTSAFNDQRINILIDNGTIKSINPEIKSEIKRYNTTGLSVSNGWFDFRVLSGEPGNEYKEDLQSLCNAMQFGGFTGGLLLPNADPVIQHKSDIQSILARTKSFASKLYPSGAITQNCDGETLNEMLDAYTAGAVAFTDGKQPLWNSDILVKTLQYLQKFNGLLINFPQDKKLALFGQMNEGVTSTSLGLKGIPKLAEEIMIRRDLELLRYAGGRIHFSTISSAKSVDLIEQAKSEGLEVTCDVSIYHLLLDDNNLKTFDANYKIAPPLREQADIDRLIEGVNSGVIDVVCSGHTPQDEDHKKLEFDLAEEGLISTQLVYALYNSFLKDRIDTLTFINAISTNPKKILGLDHGVIREGESANLTLFSDSEQWKLTEDNNPSLSNNTPYWNTELVGKAMGVVNGVYHNLDSALAAVS